MKLQTLKPRLSSLPNRLATTTGGWRTQGMSSTARGYGYAWQKARERHLQAHPLCRMCEDEGKVVPASVVDHKIPHRGDMAVFWDQGNWQSLCATHHSSHKQRQENAER